MISMIGEVFNPRDWNFQRVAFDGNSTSILSQYMTIRSTALYLSVVGTGSHLAMFLPDGSVDLAIQFCPTNHGNRYLCGISPTLHCITSPPKETEGGSCGMASKRSDLRVDKENFQKALQTAYDQLSTRCFVKLDK